MFYDNFIKLCNEREEKATPLLKSLNYSPGNLSKWKSGASVNSDILLALSEHFGVSTDYLLTGKDVCNHDADFSDDEQELLSYYSELDLLSKGKVIGKAEALAELAAECQPQPSDNPVITQSGTPAEDLEQEKDRIIYIEAYSLPASAGSGVDLDGCEKEQIAVRETDMTSDANFAIRVSGKSMEPSYHDGDIVLVRTQPEVELGQIGIFTVNDMGYIKQRGKHELISLNRQYDNIPISASDSCYCRGLVIGILDPDDLAD